MNNDKKYKYIWGLITARLNSSRLPNKALLLLHEIPMIIHVALRAKLSSKLYKVVVCTDSVEIAEMCIQYKIDVCITSSSCANGTERILEAKRNIGIPDEDIIIDIQGDEPLVSPFSINEVASYSEHKYDSMEIVLPHIELCESNNKNIVKVVCSGHQVVYLTRVDAPYFFNSIGTLKKHLSIIGFTGASLEKYGSCEKRELEKFEGVELLRAIENGMKINTFAINTDSFSVDVREDFERAERELRECPIFLNGRGY